MIIEAEIDIDCIELRKINFFHSGSISVCVSSDPDETPAPEIPEFQIEYAEFLAKPKRHIIRQGENINFCDAVTCEKSYLDFLKGVIHLFDGKIIEDIPTKTLCIYPPKNVEMPDGTLIEGYDNGSPPVEFNNFIKCFSHVAVASTETIDRYCRLGFAKSTDPFVQQFDEANGNQIHDYLHDIGEQIPNSNITEKRNPFFEPTAIKRVNGISCNGVPVYLPNLSDNTNDEVSYDIGCRVLLADAGVQIDQNGQGPELSYCIINQAGEIEIIKITDFVQGYHSMCSAPYSIS